MKIVLDTNVIVSAFVFHGKPETLLRTVIQQGIIVYYSDTLLGELHRTLKEKFEFSVDNLNKAEQFLQDNFQLVNPLHIPNAVQNDPDDNLILAIAYVSRADYLVSGDNHLLNIEKYKKTTIIRPDDFLQLLTNQSPKAGDKNSK